MELRLLRYFLAVAEEGSFTRAAARLYISQPTLSQQIRVLERAVGSPLFHRTPGGLRLTEAGHALLDPAQRTLTTAAEGIRAVRDAIRPKRSTLRVGITSPFGVGKLTSPIISTFRQAFPDIDLVFRSTTLPGLYTDLLDDQIDVSLAKLPLDPEHFSWLELFEEPRVLGVGFRHPLADAGAAKIDDFINLPMPLLMAPGTPGSFHAYWQLNEYRNNCPPDRIGHPVRSALEIAYFLLQYQNAVAIGVESMREAPLLPPPLIRLIDLPEVSGSTAVVARRRTDKRAAVTAFCEIAQIVSRQLRSLTAAYSD